MSIVSDYPSDHGQTVTPPPALTPQQREAALAKSREARKARAQVAEDLKSGKSSVAHVFAAATEEPDGPVAGMRITQVLKALPGFGPQRTTDVLTEAGVKPSRRVKGVGPKQRKTLIELTANPAR